MTKTLMLAALVLVGCSGPGPTLPAGDGGTPTSCRSCAVVENSSRPGFHCSQRSDGDPRTARCYDDCVVIDNAVGTLSCAPR